MTTNLPVEQRETVYQLASGDEMRLTMELVRKYLVTGKSDLVTRSELLFFMQECKARRLNPFLRHCWLIKYSQKENAQIVESIHHKREKAVAHPKCQGWEKGLILERDGVEIRTHGMKRPDDTLLGAWFEATPKGWNVPYRHEITLDGYVKKTREGDITKFWAPENQPSQLMKVVESQGLSALFGGDGAHTYIPEEMPEPETYDADFTSSEEEPPPDDPEAQRNLSNEFADAVDAAGLDLSSVDAFLQATANAVGKPEAEVMADALESWEGFANAYKQWAEKQDKGKKPPAKKEKAGPSKREIEDALQWCRDKIVEDQDQSVIDIMWGYELGSIRELEAKPEMAVTIKADYENAQ